MRYFGKRTYIIEMTIDFAGYKEDFFLKDLKETLRRGNTYEYFYDHEIDTVTIVGGQDHE